MPTVLLSPWPKRCSCRHIHLPLFFPTGKTFEVMIAYSSIVVIGPWYMYSTWFSINPFPTHQLKKRKHWHWDVGTEKIQAVQLGIEPRASGVGISSVVSGCGVIAQWSEPWCVLPESKGLIPSCAAWIFPFLRPNVRSFFLSTGVLGMD